MGRILRRGIDKYSGWYYPIDISSEDPELNSFHILKQRDQRNDIRYKSSKIYRIQGHAFYPTEYIVKKDGKLCYNGNSAILIHRKSRDYLPIEFW